MIIEFDPNKTDKVYAELVKNYSTEVSSLAKLIQANDDKYKEFELSVVGRQTPLPNSKKFSNLDSGELQYAQLCLTKTFIVRTIEDLINSIERFGNSRTNNINNIIKVEVINYHIEWKAKTLELKPREFLNSYQLSYGIYSNKERFVHCSVDANHIIEHCSGKPKSITIDKRDIELSEDLIVGLTDIEL